MKKLLAALAFAVGLSAAYGARAQQVFYNQLATNQISVGSTPTLIVTARANRQQLRIVQAGTTQVYIGGPAVSTTTGVPLGTTQYVTITVESGAALYGVTATGNDTVAYLESW